MTDETTPTSYRVEAVVVFSVSADSEEAASAVIEKALINVDRDTIADCLADGCRVISVEEES